MDPSSASNDDKLDVVAEPPWKKTNIRPKLAQLRGSKMTLSREEDSLVTESTQNLLSFALTKGHSLHSVTQMTNVQLAEFLRDFFTKIKLKSADTLTLKDLRAGLRKFFMDEVNIDILNDRTFDLANAAFDMALRSHRKCHRMRIETEDLKKIYLSKAMDTDKPDSLQNKVFFDVSLYICSRGKEYFRNMRKNDFVVSTDSLGRRYVWLKDIAASSEGEMKLSGGVDGDPLANQVGERMYERPGDPRCPVASFTKYLKHLHPMTEAFWQRPKRNISQSDFVWFEHTALGNSTLTKIMQRISLQAGLSDNYTNYSIRSACIPLLESVCEEALRAETAGTMVPSVDIVKSGAVMTHSASEEMSSDDGMSQTSEMQGTHSDPETRGLISSREKTPGLSSSVGSGSMDTDDAEYMSLKQAKTKVLDLIRGLMVKDIQKFVDWLKTVRVQYSGGELIVLCSPVDRSSVEPVSDEISPDRNILNSLVEKNGLSTHPSSHDHPFKRSGSLSQTEKQAFLKKSLPLKDDGYGDGSDLLGMAETTIKQVGFSSLAGFHCSSEEFGTMKISIPTHDTLLVTGIPDHLQVMLHKKKDQVGQQEPLPERVFYSENDMDVTEVIATINACKLRNKQRNINSSTNVITNGGLNNYHTSVEPQNKHHPTVQQHHASPVMVTNPAAHTPHMSSFTAREHFKYHKNKSLGCLDQPPPLPAGITLKRVYSTGTPVLKRQANVMDTSMFPENLTVKRDHEELQATNLSMKPLRQVESPEAKRARAERLTDSLRVHQEILQNSPLMKRPGERNFSGFRHSYANTVSSSVKSEPQDTSYS